MVQEVKVKRVNDLAILPTQGSSEAAGWDLYAAIEADIEIPPHSTVKIPTGLILELPQYTFGAIFARSGVATKLGLRPANCVGVCDSDYRGEYIVAMHNDTNQPQVVPAGARIAQLVIMPYVPVTMVQTDVLSETERSDGGFGSTGM